MAESVRVRAGEQLVDVSDEAGTPLEEQQEHAVDAFVPECRRLRECFGRRIVQEAEPGDEEAFQSGSGLTVPQRDPQLGQPRIRFAGSCVGATETAQLFYHCRVGSRGFGP
jgi:hypothetical protein